MYHGTVMVKPCGALRLLKGYLPNNIYFDDPNNIDPQWLPLYFVSQNIVCVAQNKESGLKPDKSE